MMSRHRLHGTAAPLHRLHGATRPTGLPPSQLSGTLTMEMSSILLPGLTEKHIVQMPPLPPCPSHTLTM